MVEAVIPSPAINFCSYLGYGVTRASLKVVRKEMRLPVRPASMQDAKKQRYLVTLFWVPNGTA